MPEPRILKLLKPWANNPAGSKLSVLEPGEDPAPGKVDPARAATLLNQQLAAEIGADASPAKPARLSTKKEA